MLHERPSETLSYQREIDKGELTTVASFEKLTFQAWALCWNIFISFAPTKGSRAKDLFFKTHYGG